ncbi:MAG: AI-2E family transporter [Synechococcales bacterium]|nr:AI-2E family transporter [Synechococcales bacterium]
MRSTEKAVQILLAIIAALMLLGALHISRPVTMPLAFAFFIAILVHPLQVWLNRRLPHWLSLVLVLLVILSVLGIGVGAIALSGEIIEPKLPRYADRLEQLLQTATTWLQSMGFTVGQGSTPSQIQEGFSQFSSQIWGGIKSILNLLSLLVLVISLLALLLLEVGEYGDRARQAFSSRTSDHLIHAVSSTSAALRRYLLVMAFTSFLTGVLTWLWCFILGVDLAYVWGLVGFVLNFIPTIGSFIAVVPPTLVAILFQGAGMGFLTLAGLATLQTILGNFVDPRLQGRYLKLSPFMALLSIIFWGWVWGIPGAFIGVPMTASIVLFCAEFKPTQPIAIMLGDTDGPAVKSSEKSKTSVR